MSQQDEQPDRKRLSHLIVEFLEENPEILPGSGLKLSSMKFNPDDEETQNSMGHCGSVSACYDGFLYENGFAWSVYHRLGEESDKPEIIDEGDDRHPINLILKDMGVEQSDDDERWQNLLDGFLGEPEDIHWADLYGMQDRTMPGNEIDGTHEATCVLYDDRFIMIDWTASQYGYEEFPLIQEFDVNSLEWNRITIDDLDRDLSKPSLQRARSRELELANKPINHSKMNINL